MKTHYGQISLTKLEEIKRQQPGLFKEVTFRDGHKELFINIEVHDKKTPDKFGNTAFIKASIGRDNEKEGVSYFIGDLKRAEVKAEAETRTEEPRPKQPSFDTPLPPLEEGQTDLPF